MVVTKRELLELLEPFHDHIPIRIRRMVLERGTGGEEDVIHDDTSDGVHVRDEFTHVVLTPGSDV